MGQALTGGFVAGGFASLVTAIPFQRSLAQTALQISVTSTMGLGLDLLSDVYAKEGTLTISRDSILRADDTLVHVYSFYATNGCYPLSRALKQKHEWVVLESDTRPRRFFTVQKCPTTGNIKLDTTMTLRHANDVGLRVAMQPTASGEMRLHRIDQEFDLASGLQLAYVIAWLRKEDPRWSMTTENSRHFTVKFRRALNDF